MISGNQTQSIQLQRQIQIQQTAQLINEQAHRTGPILTKFMCDNFGFSQESTRQIASGAAAGVASVALGQPYDMVKTRMQKFPKSYKSIKQSALKIGQKEGARAFYVGSSSPLIGAAFSEALQFTVLTKIKSALQQYYKTDDIGNSGLLLASLITGQVNALVLCPVELVKIQMQVQKQYENAQSESCRQNGKAQMTRPKAVSLLNCISQIYKKDCKLSSFYRGLNATLLRDFFFAPLFFGQYFIWKRTWSNYCQQNDIKPSRSLNYLQGFCAGAGALFSAWAVIYPIDCIKTQIQAVNLQQKSTNTSPSSILQAFQSRYNQYGIRGFYNGIGISLMRTIPVGGMSFVAYELMQEFLNDHDKWAQ